MSDPLHAIRLRGAWRITADGTRFRHARPFGWPSAIVPSERVWLVVVGVECGDSVALNGAHLGSSAEGGAKIEADVTSLLRPRNELVLTRDTESPPAEVTLEVRPADSAPA